MRRSFSIPQLLIAVRYQGLRRLLTDCLLEEGYRVKGFGTIEEIIPMLKSRLLHPTLLIVDTLHQPLSLDALDSLPMDLPMIVCTGPLDSGGSLLIPRPQTTVLQKPFTLRELVDAVHKICYKTT